GKLFNLPSGNRAINPSQLDARPVEDPRSPLFGMAQDPAWHRSIVVSSYPDFHFRRRYFGSGIGGTTQREKNEKDRTAQFEHGPRLTGTSVDEHGGGRA